MQNNSKSKTLLVFGLILIIIALVYLFKMGTDRPVQVISPEGYEQGTKLSMYEGTPAGFPKNVILEQVTLTHSSTLSLPNGSTQSKVSYKSEKPIREVFDMYKFSMIDAGWKMVTDATNPMVATISATKETHKLIITMVTEGAGTSVTFQHEK